MCMMLHMYHFIQIYYNLCIFIVYLYVFFRLHFDYFTFQCSSYRGRFVYRSILYMILIIFFDYLILIQSFTQWGIFFKKIILGVENCKCTQKCESKQAKLQMYFEKIIGKTRHLTVLCQILALFWACVGWIWAKIVSFQNSFRVSLVLTHNFGCNRNFSCAVECPTVLLMCSSAAIDHISSILTVLSFTISLSVDLCILNFNRDICCDVDSKIFFIHLV